MTVLLLAITAAALAVSAGLVASSLRLNGLVPFLLAAYVIAWAELAGSVVLLSPFHLVVRGAVVAAVAVELVAAFAVWHATGRVRPQSPAPSLRALRGTLRDPVVALLAAVVGVAFAYLTALALFTPANSWDAMWYHLARAAFWRQQHAVAYIANAPTLRLNVNPPVAEIGSLFTMVVSGSDRFATLPALSGYAALTVGVFGIARRLGAEPRAALLAALVFATLPVVVLQASGALNDLVFGAFLAVCAYFVLGRGLRELGLAGLALALALETKLVGPLLLPLVLLLLLAARPVRRASTVAIAAGALVLGSGWYLLNVVQTGAVEGHLAGGRTNEVAAHGLPRLIANIVRLLVDFVEAPGAGGWWVLAYLGSAVVAAAWAWRVRRGAVASTWTAAVALVPLVVVGVAPLAKRGYQWIFFHLGRPELGTLDQDRGSVGASALASFYGPLGVLLVLAGLALPFAASKLGVRVPRALYVCGVAPVVGVVLVGATVGYDAFLGRYFMFPVALAAAAGALLLQVRPVAWGAVAIAATTVFLALRAYDEKPFDVWGKPRWWVQTKVAGRTNGERDVIRFAAQSIPSHASIALDLRSTDWSYPFFGPHLTRTVRLVPTTERVGWLVVAPTRPSPPKRWNRVFATGDGWRVFAAGRAP